MNFLDNLRNKPRPVRVAITWGVAILLVAAIAPIWLSSLNETVVSGGEERTVVEGDGAIQLFLREAGGDVGEQFGDIRAMIGNTINAFQEGRSDEGTPSTDAATEKKEETEEPETASPDDSQVPARPPRP